MRRRNQDPFAREVIRLESEFATERSVTKPRRPRAKALGALVTLYPLRARARLLEALAANEWSPSQAARHLIVSLRVLYVWMETLNIREAQKTERRRWTRRYRSTD
jgi:hypothetical protein